MTAGKEMVHPVCWANCLSNMMGEPSSARTVMKSYLYPQIVGHTCFYLWWPVEELRYIWIRMYLGLIHFSLISSFINSVNNGLNCMKQDKVDKGRSILIQIYLNTEGSEGFALNYPGYQHVQSDPACVGYFWLIGHRPQERYAQCLHYYMPTSK